MMRTRLLLVSVLLLAGQGCIQITGAPQTGVDGGVWRSTDRGGAWEQKSAVAVVGAARNFNGSNITTMAIDPNDRKVVYAGTEQGLFYSLDAAESWQGASTLGRVRVNAVAVSPADRCVIFVGTGNRIMRSPDCARTWENVFFDSRTETRVNSVKVDALDANVVYAATSQGDFLKSGDGGDSWSPIHRFTNEVRQVLMHASDPKVLYVATVRKGLWKSADGGATWTDLTPGLGDYAGAVDRMILAESPAKPGWLFLASNYGLLKSEDAGGSWKPIALLTPPGSTVLYSLAVSPKDPGVIWYGTANTLYRTLDGGGKWTTSKLSTTRAATALLVDPSEDTLLYMGTTRFEKQQPF